MCIHVCLVTIFAKESLPTRWNLTSEFRFQMMLYMGSYLIAGLESFIAVFTEEISLFSVNVLVILLIRSVEEFSLTK